MNSSFSVQDDIVVLWFYAAVYYQYVPIKDASINHCVTLDAKDVGSDLIANQIAVDID
jgi:hypothetical protein